MVVPYPEDVAYTIATYVDTDPVMNAKDTVESPRESCFGYSPTKQTAKTMCFMYDGIKSTHKFTSVSESHVHT
jgi:hypothetical protein